MKWKTNTSPSEQFKILVANTVEIEIIYNTKILQPQVWMILTDVGYHVKALCFIYSQRLLNYTQRKKLSTFCSKTCP